MTKRGTAASRCLGAALTCWLTVVCALASGHAVPADAQDLSGGALLAALRNGGYVIYFRHADTGPATPDPPGVDLERCETQRNLDAKGRSEARAIGAAFQQLHIPVGRVLSSRFCRCRETAALAFGRYELASTLTGVPRGEQFTAAREQASGGLRELLSTPPQPGTNTVLVSHGFNLIDLEGLYLSTQGEAAIYQPLTPGGYRLVARVLPDGWMALGGARNAAGKAH